MLQNLPIYDDTAVAKREKALYASCGRACVRRHTGTPFRSIGELIDAVARDDPAVPRELTLDFGGSASRAAARCLARTADPALCPAQFVCCLGCGTLWWVPWICCKIVRKCTEDRNERVHSCAKECEALSDLPRCCGASTCASHTALAVAESQEQILEQLGKALRSNTKVHRLTIRNLASNLQECRLLPSLLIDDALAGWEDFGIFVEALTTAPQPSNTQNTALQHLELNGLGRIKSEELVQLLRALALQTLTISTARYECRKDNDGDGAADGDDGDDDVLKFLLTESDTLDELTLEDLGGSPVERTSEAFRRQAHTNKSVRRAAKDLRDGSPNIWLTEQLGHLVARHVCFLGEALGHTSGVSFDFSGSVFARGAAAELAHFCREHCARIAGLKLHGCTWEPDEAGESDGHVSRRALLEISGHFPGAFSEQDQEQHGHVDLLGKILATGALSGASEESRLWVASCPVLPKALSKCQVSLVHLDACGLSDECASVVVEGLSRNRHVEVVDLRSNRFTDIGSRKLDELVTASANTRLALLTNCSCQATFVGEPKNLLTALAKRNMALDVHLTPSNLQKVTEAWRGMNLDWANQRTFREPVRNEAQVLEALNSTELTAFESVPNTVSDGIRLRKVIKNNWVILSGIPVDLRVNCLSDVDAAELAAEFPALFANLAPQFGVSPVAVKHFNSAEDVGKRVLQAYFDRPGDVAVRSLLRDTVAASLIDKVIEERLLEPPPREMTSDRFEGLLKFMVGESAYDNITAKEQNIFDWQPLYGECGLLDLSFIDMHDADAARLASALLAEPDKALHVLLWGNNLKNDGALKLLDIMVSTEHKIDMRWNPFDQDAMLEALAADPTRYAYLQSKMDPAVLKERILARSMSSQKDLAGRLCRALIQRPEEMEYMTLFGSLEEEIQDTAWEEQRPLSRDQDISNAMKAFQAFKLRHYSCTSFVLDTVLPVSDVFMDIVQGLLYCINKQVQFLCILGFGCALNAVGTAHAAYTIKGSKRLAVLNLATVGLGGFVLESLESKKTGAKTDMLFVYKKFETVEASVSWATGCYSLLIAGFLKDYPELELPSTCVKWFSLLLSLVTIPKSAFDASKREAAQGQSLRQVYDELRSTGGVVALFLFHAFDLASLLILFPFALSTRPIGIFLFLLVKAVAIYSAAVVNFQKPPCAAVVQALSLQITNPAQSDPQLAALSLRALQIRILSVVIAWLITASKMYSHEKLAFHLLQPGNACILLLATVSLIGLLCCARFWWKRGFWAAAAFAPRPQVVKEQGHSTLSVGDDSPAEAPLLLAP